MKNEGIEKRKYKRIFFPLKDKITGVITFPDAPDESFSALLMNLSEGGVCLALSKDEMIRFNENDRLILSEIKGSTLLQFIANVDMEVRRVMDNQFFKHIELGCEFQNMSDSIREQIRNIVDSEDL